MKTIVSSHIKALQKVRQQLCMRQTMTYTQIIAGEKNIRKINDAEDLIFRAINKLSEVE